MSARLAAARVWVKPAGAAALAVAVLSVWPFSAAPRDWLALAFLGLCAAAAHVFPIRSASDGGAYRLTNVFVAAAAIVLPPGLLSLMVVLAVGPERVLHRRPGRPRQVLHWLADATITATAAHLASAAVRWTGSDSIDDVHDLVVLLGAAALFTSVQALLADVAAAALGRPPSAQARALALPMLLSDGLLSLLGVLVAGLWAAKPELLLFVPALLLVAHRLTRMAHLAHLAQVDGKTGLYNSRFLERALEEELAQSVRAKQPLALLFADLDFLRRVNNQYGHLAGDRVLQDIAALLARSVRKGDLIARFGGEEFVVLLPGTDLEEAVYRAEQLRRMVEDHRVVLDDVTRLRCTVSIGVAAYPDHGADAATLIKQADAAMYRAKEVRNAVARPRTWPRVPRLPAAAGAPAPPPVRGAGPRGPAAPLAARPRGGESGTPSLMLWGTVAAGVLIAGWSLLAVHRAAAWLPVLPFLAIAAGAEFFRVRVYEGDREAISLSFTTALTMAAMAVQPVSAPLVAVVAAAAHAVSTRQRDLRRVGFDLAYAAAAAGAATHVYLSMRAGGAAVVWDPAAALAGVLTLYVANVGVLALMISLHTGTPITDVVREPTWLSPANVVLDTLLGLTGSFLGTTHAHLGLAGSAMVAIPVVIMRYTLAFYALKSRQAIETLLAAKAEAEQAHEEKEETLRTLIETVASIIDARDHSVAGHSHRVARYAVALGQELGMSPADLALLHTAGLLHDLGKVAVSEAILNKPARLSAAEYELIKHHAATGERILAEVRQLEEVARMVGEHHERYDGSGYPAGKRSGAIHVGGRILAVADALDSMLADRPYSQGKGLAYALAELTRCAGTHFDPQIVAVLQRLVDEQGPEFFEVPPERAAASGGADAGRADGASAAVKELVVA